MRVLVVEDEKDLNSIICSKLVKEGYNVDACYDGQAALDYMEAENYDGAIMDIMIPNKDGITVLREMRNAGIQVPEPGRHVHPSEPSRHVHLSELSRFAHQTAQTHSDHLAQPQPSQPPCPARR